MVSRIDSHIRLTKGLGRTGQFDVNLLSEYHKMILHMDENISSVYFGLAAFFSWLLLAGFLVSPSTYASTHYLDAAEKTGDIGKAAATAVRNIPLVFIASFACLIASTGLGWLWVKWRGNYVWISRCLIVPTLMHSVMGFVSTLLNVYGTQDRQWSITAIISAVIIGGWLLLSFTAYIIYEWMLLPNRKLRPLISST